MWLWTILFSALFLGAYDASKKQSLKRNGVMWVLFAVSVLSTLLLVPFISWGSLHDHTLILPKAAVVTVSWISGLIGIKLLPLTTASTIKSSRPVFVVVFSILLFSESLNLCQWLGVGLAIAALFLLGRTSRREGITFKSNKGLAWMALSVITGAASALYDKYIIQHLDPMFVLSWCNLYIAVLMGIVLAVKQMHDGESRERFTWDWNLLLTAVLIVSADALYFYSISMEGSLLSVISLLRRGSVIVTFALGAVFFGEKNIRSKAVDLTVLLAGLTLLVLGSGNL